LASLAREIFSQCQDVEITTRRLIKKLRADPALFKMLMTEIVHDAVHVHSSMSMRNDRKAILQRANALHFEGPEDVVALAEGLKSAFLDFWVGSGLRLRDADRDQVSTKAAQYQGMSRDTGHKARWLNLIAQSLPANKKVGDVLDEDRVAELWQETANA
jgi:hypothetical protein